MNYEKPKNETEILSADEQTLREMCRALKKVEAPGDFDFKLKARLAAANSAEFKPRRFGFAFRYALPALALILVLGLLAYNGGFLSSGDNPIIAGGGETSPPNPVVAQNPAAPMAATPGQNPAPNAAIPSSTQNSPKVPATTVAFRKPQRSGIDKKRRPAIDNSIRSKDIALTEIKSKLPTINANPVSQNPATIENSNPVPVKNVLNIMGISADFENGKWTVKSVTANSIGEKSGVKENDVIEAIDDEPLNGGTVFNKTVKAITVTRNGEKSEIRLRGKQ